MDAKIAVNLDHIDLGNAFSRPISPLKANLLLQDGTLALTDIYAHTADGTVSGKLSIDTHASADHDAKARAPTWHINLNWKDIDLDKWLKISAERKKEAKQAGDKETPPSYVTGKLVGKTKLIGSGNSTAEMLSTLDGEVSIYIHKGTISHLVVEALGLDIAQGLGLLLTGDKPLPMQCAVMDLSAKNGIATPKVALIDTPVTLVLINGTVDLAKETLDLKLAAKPKNISPFTVRSPIHVKGSFKNPDVSVEKTPIVARVLGSVALAFVNPLAAILPFIDTGSGEKSPCNESLIEFQKKPQ
jgi:AsmA protein